MLRATFGVLQQILLDLGFTMRAEATFIRFDHAGSNTWFLFPPHTSDEEVNARNLVGVRHILDTKGLLSRERFEELLRERLIAG
jgi:hypothetical protein